jgi:meiotically up-regulated gene 157 (Mug157) protein
MSLPSKRPAPADRAFSSPVIEDLLARTASRIADPHLAWLFANCLPNTLDTTVTHSPDDGTARPDTFIITGDIAALWLRDSTNQVWPYLPYARQCPRLQAMLRGLIHRQARCVLLDPYANAFYRDPATRGEFQSDHTDMKPGVHERKYELDSLASVLRLATGYFDATGDPAPFDREFLAALDRILDTIASEQAGTPEQIHPRYSFARSTANALDTLPNGAHGNPCRRTGMSRSPFRPSDDASILQYHIPANAMAAVMLERMDPLLAALSALHPRDAAAQSHLGQLRATCAALAATLRAAIAQHARFARPSGPAYAYEVDGFGGAIFMDDANLPSLLSLPYLGFCPSTDPIYQNTRRLVLSSDNPYYHQGAAARGIGSPHVGLGWIWPLSLITQALTSTDDEEILTCLRALNAGSAGTGFMHEAFWMNDPARFTRHWFAWANTFFGELILHLAHTRPHLLQEPLA